MSVCVLVWKKKLKGALAHLVERDVRNVKVRGSYPPASERPAKPNESAMLHKNGFMKRINQKYIDQTFLFAKKSLEWSFVALILLSVMGLIPEILNKYGFLSDNWSTIYFVFAKPVIGLSLIILFLSVAVVLVLSLTTTSSKDIRDASIIDSPLANLTVEQEQKIIALLKEKGTPTNEDGKMNRAKVTYILNALKDLGYISSAVDDNTLRLWVIKETGYKEDDLDHFRESMGRSQKNNIALRTKEMIEKMLSNGA